MAISHIVKGSPDWQEPINQAIDIINGFGDTSGNNPIGHKIDYQDPNVIGLNGITVTPHTQLDTWTFGSSMLMYIWVGLSNINLKSGGEVQAFQIPTNVFQGKVWDARAVNGWMDYFNTSDDKGTGWHWGMWTVGGPMHELSTEHPAENLQPGQFVLSNRTGQDYSGHVSMSYWQLFSM